jgi:hypothetical protein
LDAKQLAHRVGNTLDALPGSHRKAYQLVRHEGLSMAQASRELGVSIGAVQLRVYRASQALRKRAIRADLSPSIPHARGAARIPGRIRKTREPSLRASNVRSVPTSAVNLQHITEVSP